MRKRLSKEELVNVFARAAALHSQALLAGDHRIANREARIVSKTFRQLTEMGDEGRQALTLLFTHANDDVASLAAAYLLRYATDEAVQVLERIARKKGLVGFQAQQALERWREGDWHLDE